MLSLVRTQSGGIRRYFSPYLASAFLMLAGAYQLLYRSDSNPYREITYLFLTQLCYHILLVVLAVYLFRKAKLIEDTFLLISILSLFLMDVLFIQHLYGWVDQVGMNWAIGSCIVSVLLLFGASSALGLNQFNRMTVTLACLICFIRLGPRLLIHNELAFELSFSYVGLSWLFASCLLPVIFLPEPTSKFDSLSTDLMERAVLPVAFGLALIHFLTAGDSFLLPFEFVYLAPFTVVLPIAVEKLFSPQSAGMKKICTLLSVLGLFFAASKQSLPVYDIFGLGEGPLTPFWFTLIASAAIFWKRSFSNQRPGLLHFSALALCMSFLGGNLSEVLVNIFYPQLWHVLFVPAVCLATNFYTRLIRPSIWLNLLPTLVIACWLAESQIPFVAGFFMVSAISTLMLELTSSVTLLPRLRMILISFVLVLPLIFLFVQETLVTKVLFASVCLAFYAWGFFSRKPSYLWSSAAAVVAAALGYPLAMQMHAGASIGRIFIQLAFISLLIGFSNSLYGFRIGGFIKQKFQSAPTSSLDDPL